MTESIASTDTTAAHKVNVDVKHLADLNWKLSGVVTPEILAAEKASRIAELRKSGNLRIKGFRPNRITPQIIERFYGKDVEEEALHKLVNEAIDQTLQSEALVPVSSPEVQWDTPQDQGHQFSITFESLPKDMVLAPFDQIEVEKLVADISDLDIEKALDQSLDRHMTLEQVDVPAANDHYVLIDFKGTIDGKPFPGGEVESFKLKLGSGTMIAGFEENLLGLKAGDEKDFQLTFPSNYPMQEMANKKVDFHVHLRQVNTAKPPELTEKFLQENFDIEDGQLATLRHEIKEKLERHAAQIAHSHLSKQVLEQLFIAHQDSLIPKILLCDEINRLRSLRKDQNNESEQAMTVEELTKIDLKNTKDDDVRQAWRNVTLFIVLQRVAKLHDMELDETRMIRRLYGMLGQSEATDQYLQELLLGGNHRARQLRADVFEEQILDYIIEQVQTTDKKVSYQKLVEEMSAV